jgi:F-type H+-transporting ATPase subunit epsilon
MTSLHIEIVSAEKTVFVGEAKFVSLPGENGELGVLPGHAPLISKIKPGTVYIELLNDSAHEYIFIAGGIIEVQPSRVIVLADTAIRGDDLDEAKAQEAKQRAQEIMETQQGNLDLAKAQSEIMLATAQLAAIARLRNKRY